MKLCPICGYEDNPLWRYSRFDYNADYMRFDEAKAIKELHEIYEQLKDKQILTLLKLAVIFSTVGEQTGCFSIVF